MKFKAKTIKMKTFLIFIEKRKAKKYRQKYRQ